MAGLSPAMVCWCGEEPWPRALGRSDLGLRDPRPITGVGLATLLWCSIGEEPPGREEEALPAAGVISVIPFLSEESWMPDLSFRFCLLCFAAPGIKLGP